VPLIKAGFRHIYEVDLTSPSAEPADVWQPPGTEDCLTTEAALRRLDEEGK